MFKIPMAKTVLSFVFQGIATPSARNDFPYRHCEEW